MDGEVNEQGARQRIDRLTDSTHLYDSHDDVAYPILGAGAKAIVIRLEDEGMRQVRWFELGDRYQPQRVIPDPTDG